VNALGLTRDINRENDRIVTALFRQELMERNCARYAALANMFPDVVTDDCVAKTRWFRPRAIKPQPPPPPLPTQTVSR
jgi:hypothetical protein